ATSWPALRARLMSAARSAGLVLLGSLGTVTATGCRDPNVRLKCAGLLSCPFEGAGAWAVRALEALREALSVNWLDASVVAWPLLNPRPAAGSPAGRLDVKGENGGGRWVRRGSGSPATTSERRPARTSAVLRSAVRSAGDVLVPRLEN